MSLQIKHLTILLHLLILLSFCNSDNKINPALSDQVTPPPTNTIQFRDDTLEFESFSQLISYFGKRIDSVETVHKKISAQKNNGYIFINDQKKILRFFSDSLIKERNKSIYKFVRTRPKNSESFSGLKYFILDWQIPIIELDSLFSQFPFNLQKSKEGIWLKDQLDKRRTTETLSNYNTEILNKTFYTTSGNVFTLDNISSKYILLDFWASWCSPCRYENRELNKLKDAINNVGNLTLIAISLDEDKDKWLMASQEDKLNYLNFSDYKAFDSELVKTFKITAIPYNVLINKNGDILGTNLWGDKLKETIKTLK